LSDLLQLLQSDLPERARGIEIGAHALPVPGLSPFYVDRVRTYAGSDARVDIQADAMALPVPDGELDYLCSSHVLEHLANPTGGLLEWHRVLRDGGYLYLIVPDKRYTFDISRKVTTPAHLIADFYHAVSTADADHVREFIYESDWERLQPACKPEDKPGLQKLHFDHYIEQVKRGESVDIHYHTFTPDSLAGFLRAAGLIGGSRPYFELVAQAERYPPQRGDGIGFLLKKRGRSRPTGLATFRFEHPRGAAQAIQLVCPATLAPLEVQAAGAGAGQRKLNVKGHNRSYDFSDGIPNLMPVDAIDRRWNSRLRRRWFIARAQIQSWISR
jgi:SAM-dependent methyltransferase/uncharacterized protein YbaR (Trm112 family)